MKCAYCGKRNKDGAVVCKRCGIALAPPLPSLDEGDKSDKDPKLLNEPASADGSGIGLDNGGINDPEKDKRASKRRKLIAIACAAALLVLAAVIAIAALSSNSIILPLKNGYFASTPSGLFCKDKVVCPTGEHVKYAASDLRGARAAIVTTEGNLYSYYRGKETAVSKGVSDFQISGNGKILVFKDEKGLLWSYDNTKNGTAPVCISSDPVDEYALSPNGKTVIFTNGDGSELFICQNAKTKSLGGGLAPVSVSDNGNHIYAYSASDNALYYVRKNAKSTFIRGNIGPEIYLNSKHTEVVFSVHSGPGIVITMICSGGKEPVEIINTVDSVAPVLPATAYSTGMLEVKKGGYVLTCPMSSFDNRLFAGEGLVKYTKKGSTVIDPKPITDAVATDDYRTVYYVTDGNLQRVSVKSSSEPERISIDCMRFRISSSGAVIWYTDGANTLHYLRGKRNVEIATNVSEFQINRSGSEAVFIANGVVCINKSGNPKKCYSYDDIKAEALFSNGKQFFAWTSSGWEAITGKGVRIEFFS
ncbi:MAG: hypothetical protein IJM18_00145 [Clostridia bacterium]|nr:hypothetical protein [Clostridia bacterium]